MTQKSYAYDTAPPCGLFLRLSDVVLGGNYIKQLREILFVINNAPSAYKKNSHIVACDTSILDVLNNQDLKIICEAVQRQGVVFLMEDDAKRAQNMKADGVYLNSHCEIKKAREYLSPDHIIGLRCGLDIDKAEQAIKDGADFVVFHTQNRSMPDPKIAAIWSTLSDMPCLLEGPFTNDYVAAYVKSGASFIDATNYILDHKDGVKKATVNMIHAIELALKQMPEEH